MTTQKEHIVQVLSQAYGLSGEILEPLLEEPADRTRGDLALPCFKLAPQLKRSPDEIADLGKTAISDTPVPGVISVEAVGAFLNFRFDPEFQTRALLKEILSQSEGFGSSEEGLGKTIVLDYSSPNIAKPFGVGHLRSTVIGRAVSNLLAFLGYETVRVNHLGDWGTQFGKLMAAYKEWGNDFNLDEEEAIQELLALYVRFHQAAEADAGWEEKGREWFKRLEDGEPEAVRLWNWFKEISLREFEKIYRRLGVEFDSFSGEAFYNDKMVRVIEKLEGKGLLKESRGARIVDLEPYGLTPVLIQRSDDASLYATRDLAAAFYRYDTYRFHKNLYFVASQQNEHFQQVFKTLDLLGEEWAKDCVHVPFGLIRFGQGVMSTRKGNVVFLEDVLDQAVERVQNIIEEKNADLPNKSAVAEQVGVGAIIFYDLSRKRIKDWEFVWDRILNFDGETGPYVMYSHARLRSILHKASERGRTPLSDVGGIEFSALDNPEARDLIQTLEAFPLAIQRAAEQYEPSILAQSVIDIADRANRFYNAHHVLVEDASVAETRLLLVQSVCTLLKTGLNLLGVAAPEEM